jgi:DNA-binding response OmpR family regulator
MPQMVMVVEDDANIGTLVRTYLQRDGYDALWVRSGEDALAELPRHPIALVVLDIGLPGIDGFEVLRRIGGRVPVVMLTARDEVADREFVLSLPSVAGVPGAAPGERAAAAQPIGPSSSS